MESHIHSMTALFEQLGLDNSDQGIERFIIAGGPIPSNMVLWESELWNDVQAQTLKQMKEEDADWAQVVDELDVMLR